MTVGILEPRDARSAWREPDRVVVLFQKGVAFEDNAARSQSGDDTSDTAHLPSEQGSDASYARGAYDSRKAQFGQRYVTTACRSRPCRLRPDQNDRVGSPSAHSGAETEPPGIPLSTTNPVSISV
jgi:hypothetical protein